MKKQEEVKQAGMESVNRNPVVPRNVIVREEAVKQRDVTRLNITSMLSNASAVFAKVELSCVYCRRHAVEPKALCFWSHFICSGLLEQLMV